MREDLEQALAGITGPTEESARVSYMIWGAAVTTTRAFDSVSLRVDPGTNRVFVKIKLRWFVRSKKFKKLHDAWLSRAEKRCKEYLPENWRMLLYYEGGEK